MSSRRRPHVVALCGSTRSGSYTRMALGHVVEAAESAGATTDLVDVGSLSLPVFDPDDPNAGDARSLRRRVRASNAVVLGTPTYHGSYASPLKTAIDYCGFDEFEGKTVGLLAVSGGPSAYVGPLADLRGVARALHAWVLPTQVGVGAASEAFAADGTFRDGGSPLAGRLASFGREVVTYANVASTAEADRIADLSADA